VHISVPSRSHLETCGEDLGKSHISRTSCCTILAVGIGFRSRSWIKFKSPMLNGWRPNFGCTGLLSGQSGLWRNQRARKEKAQELRSDLHALRVQGRAAVRRGVTLGARSAVHFAPSGLRAENSQRGQAKFPRKKDKALGRDGPAVVVGALCVLVWWTAWDRDTVAEKHIKAFELRELKLMDPTGLSLLANGWHESLPAKCSEDGGKKGPCSREFRGVGRSSSGWQVTAHE
jgi:hypothetical protein